jgi:hypothetical protein
MLDERRGEPVAAEERPDLGSLAGERLGDRRVVKDDNRSGQTETARNPRRAP